MGEDFQAASFREVVQALQKSTEVMAIVSEKLVSLEKSMDGLDENVGELLGVLKNGRLRDIQQALLDHDSKMTHCSTTCLNSFSSVMEEIVRQEMGRALSSPEYQAVIMRAIKGQMDPSDPEHLTPVAVKQEIKNFEWRAWINGRVLVVAGALVTIIELALKLWLQQ